MDISGFACQAIKRIYHTARVLHHSLKPAPNQINRQNRKYIHKNYYLPEAGHYIVPILVKPLYTIICKLIQVLVLPLYIKTIMGILLCSLFLFVAMQKERVNRERKTRYLFAILWIAQALTGALCAVAVFYPSPLWGEGVT